MTYRRALVLLVVLVLAAGLLPAGAILDQRLGDALVDRARDDLGRAPMVLQDRLEATRTVRMMHARDFSLQPELVSAMASQDHLDARRILTEAARSVQEEPLLIGESGQLLEGPGEVPAALVEATREGEMPVSVVAVGTELHLMALAPVHGSGSWVGAVGGSTRFGDAEAGTLAGLTRSDVLVLNDRGQLVGASIERDAAVRLAGQLVAALPLAGEVEEVQTVDGGDRTFLAASSPLDEGRVVFARDLEEELAVLPTLRRTALLAAGVSLLFALFVGVVFAAGLSRPISELAVAAQGFAAGRPNDPLKPSRISEVQRLSETFTSMRATLAARLRELEDRQARLAELQSELLHRERSAATGRLLAQLAHEIRNPIASVRNCLELVRRKGELQGEARDFADMAVDELLRMHELSERMLDLHRPQDPDEAGCRASQVAEETAALVRAGAPVGAGPISVVGSEEDEAAIGKDALKQVLLNLTINAREASPAGSPIEIVVSDGRGRVRLEVLDRGPGLRDEDLPRLFDPFFTTKTEVQGVGLGLYTAEVLVRAAGGKLQATNRADGPGARFVIDLPALVNA